MDQRQVRIWILVSIGLALLYLPGAIRLRQLKAARLEMERTLAQAVAENERLRRERERLLSDPDYLEAVARNEYHMTREGETLVRFPDENR